MNQTDMKKPRRACVSTFDVRRDFLSPQFPALPVPAEAWRNGLVVRMPNHLGDAVMALPALKQLKAIVPEYCALAVIAPAGQRALYASLPIVDVVIELERIHKSWSRGEFLRLRRQRFSVGVLFNNSLRDAALMRMAGVRYLYGAAARCRSLLLFRHFGFPSRPDGRPAEIHQTNKLLAMTRAMGAPEWDGTFPEFELKPSLHELSESISSICEHPRLLTIASGAAYGAAKRWPAECFQVVAHCWVRHGGVVAVLGSSAERGIGDEVIANLSERKAFNLCGRTGLPDLMHLLKHSLLTVANDSGVMHLAAALGTPGVAVFGPTDYTATGPVNSQWRLMYDKMDCSPCFKRVCPDGDAVCIKKITPAMVIREMREIAAARGMKFCGVRKF